MFSPRLLQGILSLPAGKLKVSVRDKQGNITRIERTILVGRKQFAPPPSSAEN